MTTCADGRSAPLSLIHPGVQSVFLEAGFFSLLLLSLFADYMLKF